MGAVIVSVVNSAVNGILTTITTNHFHNIYLARCGPTYRVKALTQHPDSRPQALPLW